MNACIRAGRIAAGIVGICFTNAFHLDETFVTDAGTAPGVSVFSTTQALVFMISDVAGAVVAFFEP
jgi:hypothetical protein